jgi:RNA polymerase sigma-70 factor, ECF subfamily
MDTGAPAAQQDDAQLMLQYAQGDAQAFNMLYARHKTWLYRVLVRQLQDQALAQDVFQDTWLTIVRTAHTYEPRAKFSTWLYGLARQRLIDAHRKHQHQPEWLTATFNGQDDALSPLEQLADPLAPDPQDQAAWAQFGASLLQAVQALPAAQREVFLLWCEASLTVEEIAQALAQNTEAVKSRLRYARARLRSALQAFAPAETTV